MNTSANFAALGGYKMKSKPKTKAGKASKMADVMHEFKTGNLRSGSRAGPKVKKRKQAIAIGLAESGQSRKRKKM